MQIKHEAVSVMIYSWIINKNVSYNLMLNELMLLSKLGLGCFSFASYSEECFTQIYRPSYGYAMFVSLGGTQT